MSAALHKQRHACSLTSFSWTSSGGTCRAIGDGHMPCLPLPHIPLPNSLCQSVTDGQWHMLGVTTRPGGGKGFQLFVDGRMVAEAVEGVEYIGTYRHLSSCRAQLLPCESTTCLLRILAFSS